MWQISLSFDPHLAGAQHYSSLCPLVGKYSLRDNSASDLDSRYAVQEFVIIAFKIISFWNSFSKKHSVEELLMGELSLDDPFLGATASSGTLLRLRIRPRPTF